MKASLKAFWAYIFACLFQPIVDYFDTKLIPDWRKAYKKYSVIGTALLIAFPTIWDQFLASGYKELLPEKFKTTIEVIGVIVLILRMIKQTPTLASLFPTLAAEPGPVVIPSPATLNSTEGEEVPVQQTKT